jgi:uncharacterized membrane protein
MDLDFVTVDNKPQWLLTYFPTKGGDIIINPDRNILEVRSNGATGFSIDLYTAEIKDIRKREVIIKSGDTTFSFTFKK